MRLHIDTRKRRLYFHTRLMCVTQWVTALNQQREISVPQKQVMCSRSVSGHLLDSRRKMRQIHLDRK